MPIRRDDPPDPPDPGRSARASPLPGPGGSAPPRPGSGGSARAHLATPPTQEEQKTIDLCNQLAEYAEAGAFNRDLLLEAGSEAVASHPTQLEVLLTVGRMYIAADELGDAERSLQRAASIAPRDERVARLLGSVLLRRGDARSAARALGSAISGGSGDAETQTLHDRARRWVPVQDEHGEEHVAEEHRRRGRVASPPPDHRSARASPAPRRAESPPPGRLSGPPRPSWVPREEPIPDRSSPASEPPEAGYEPAYEDDDAELVTPEGAATAGYELSTSFRLVRRTEAPAEPAPAPRLPIPAPDPGAAAARSATPRDPVADRAPPSPPALPIREAPASEPAAPPPHAHRAPEAPVAARREDEPTIAPAGRAAPRPRSRVRSFVTLVAALALVAGPAYLGLRKRGAIRAQSAAEIVARVQAPMQRADPAALAEVEGELARAREIDPAGREAALSTARLRALQVLEVDGAAAPALTAAIADARTRGVGDGELAFAAVVAAIGAREANQAESLVARYDQDPRRHADAFYELAAGAALELVADARATERYKAALGVDPRLFPAEVRLVRALLLSSAAAQGRSRAQGLARAWPDRPEPAILVALGAARDATRADMPSGVTAGPGLSRSVRSLARAIAVAAKSAPVADLTAAIADADAPAVAAFCGGVALEAGQAPLARDAAHRALETAPGYGPALLLGPRIALAEGRLEEMQEAARSLDPAVAVEFQALAAYEQGDAAKLAQAAQTASDPGPAAATAVWACRDRLLGTRPLDRERMTAMRASRVLWADVVSVDAALDEGDLTVARSIVDGWTDGARHPLRSLRLARLLRYEGRVADARAALAVAAPTRPALIEGALLDAETRPDRDRAAGTLGERLEPERRWLQAYLTARQGRVELAQAELMNVKDPPLDAPLTLRIVASLALGEAHVNERGEPLARPLLSAFRKNPDVIRAAVGLGFLPATALPRHSGP